MLARPTLENLHALRLTGMARVSEEQLHLEGPCLARAARDAT